MGLEAGKLAREMGLRGGIVRDSSLCVARQE
jgi:hypothetical protein